MPPRILVADDESHILNIVSLKLRKAGYDVITAGDGAQAFDQACSQRPALIITDFHMPVLSGVEMCRRVREETDLRCPSILLTARGSDVSPEQLAASGIMAVVSKPFSPRELLETVNTALAAA